MHRAAATTHTRDRQPILDRAASAPSIALASPTQPAPTRMSPTPRMNTSLQPSRPTRTPAGPALLLSLWLALGSGVLHAASPQSESQGAAQGSAQGSAQAETSPASQPAESAAGAGAPVAPAGGPASVRADPDRVAPGMASPASSTAAQGAGPSTVPALPVETVSTQPAAPLEIWDRIRSGFSMPDLQSDLVRQHERWYTARPESLQRMIERSRKYMFHIVEELEQRSMPSELALLPFVESAFNPQAVSIARAAGLWQFMPATGRDFDLKQNVFRDDRRDVLASTRAALDYLQKLYGMFGDWHLALAAYNWGEGSVGRAIARNQRAGKGTRYEDLSMPNETRNYVPKLLALKNVVAAPDDFRIELPAIDNHPYFQDVEIRRDIDVALAAQLADVRLEDFRALNPSANRPVILAAGTGKILLPWENAEVFKRNLEAYRAGRLASWTAWSVPATLSVAEAAKRAGMSEAELRSINNIPPRMLIKAGSTLVIPRPAHVQHDVSGHLAEHASLALAPELSARRTTIKARKGDTVALIARRHKISEENLAQWNKVAASASFRAGETVVLYLPPRAGGNAARSVAAKPLAKAKQTDKRASAPTRKPTQGGRKADPKP
jgi:membrane-bound lytic murein transglycosylase D